MEDSCEIKDFTATSTTCDAEGSFFVDLHLNPVGSASDSFYVYHDIGELLGTFSYRDDSVRVGPFNAYSRDLLYLIVQDKEAEDCSAKILVDKPTNCHNQCELGDLEVDLINCYDQTFYDLLISIDYFPDTYADRKFNLIIERKDYGTYSFSDLPLTINRVNILTEATFFPVALCLKPFTNDEDECSIDFNVNNQDCQTGVSNIRTLDSIVNSKTILPSIDVVIIDLKLQHKDTVATFAEILTSLKEDCVIIITNKNFGNTSIWEVAKSHPKTTLTLDFYQIGFVFFKHDNSKKEHLTLINNSLKPWSIL